MATEHETYEAYVTEDNKIGITLTKKEYEKMTGKGVPDGFRLKITENKSENSSKKPERTILGCPESEYSAEEREALRDYYDDLD